MICSKHGYEIVKGEFDSPCPGCEGELDGYSYEETIFTAPPLHDIAFQFMSRSWFEKDDIRF
jgi:hypothetical protein